MIQPIYTSVNNADIVPCGKKGTIIKSDPIPLLRNNYLGEYRTELEKAKVRKNLGIGDEYSLQWGNIEGFVESQKDLVAYVESKWNYTTELNEDIKNIQDAMDYALYFVTNFKGEHDAIVEITEEITNINKNISQINLSIEQNSTDIDTLEKSLEETNKAITQLNEDLKSINVDANILAWIKAKLKDSKTIELVDDINLEVIISDKQDNALFILEEEGIKSGLYVKDLSSEISKTSESIEIINQKISELQESTSSSGIYDSELKDSDTAPSTIGGIQAGTTVGELRNKSIDEILDKLIFPTSVRELIYPQFYYNTTYQLLEIGSSIIKPILTFIQNDAGDEISRTESLTFNGQEITEEIYSMLGKYIHSATIEYSEGPSLINNKGEDTGIKVPAGQLTTNSEIVTTYPWYADSNKQQLIPFNTSSGEIEVSLSGNANIKLPGKNSKLNLFQVNGGLGYMDVDLTGWTKTEETINNYPYQVWTKNDSYPSLLPHKLNFILKE